MKLTALANKKGFTLIELIVVIAILGVLAAVLVTTIDPLDKINSANDTGVVSSVAQFGRAMDSYGANHNSYYVTNGTANAALAILNAQGEIKMNSYTQPTGYTAPAYLTAPATCTAGVDCTGFAFTTSALKAKKNINGTSATAGPYYQYVNGKGCYVLAVITQAQLVTLGSASTGTGACP